MERSSDGEASWSRLRDNRVPDRDEPERRSEPGVDQAQAGRPRRRLLRHRGHRPGVEDGAHADRRGDPRRAVRLGHDGQHEHGLLGGLHRHLRLARDVHRRPRRPARRRAAERVRERILTLASKELEIDPADLEINDGEVVAKGAPQKKINVADVAGAATYNYGEVISGSSTALKPFADVDDATGQVEIEPHSAISYAACVAEVEVDDETGEVVVQKMVQVYDVGRAINPTLVEGQIEGGAIMGLGLGLLEDSYPYYPSVEHRGGQFGAYLAPALRDMPELDNVIIENPSADGPFGAKAIGEMANNAQPPAIANAIFDAVGVWLTEMRATPDRVLAALAEKREPRRDGKRVIFDEEISVKAVSADGGAAYFGVDA